MYGVSINVRKSKNIILAKKSLSIIQQRTDVAREDFIHLSNGSFLFRRFLGPTSERRASLQFDKPFLSIIGPSV